MKSPFSKQSKMYFWVPMLYVLACGFLIAAIGVERGVTIEIGDVRYYAAGAAIGVVWLSRQLLSPTMQVVTGIVGFISGIIGVISGGVLIYLGHSLVSILSCFASAACLFVSLALFQKTCPKCGSVETKLESSPNSGVHISLTPYYSVCLDCRHQWRH